MDHCLERLCIAGYHQANRHRQKQARHRGPFRLQCRVGDEPPRKRQGRVTGVGSRNNRRAHPLCASSLSIGAGPCRPAGKSFRGPGTFRRHAWR